MGVVLLAIVVVLAVAAFILLRQASEPHQANAVVSLAAGALVLIGFLTFPWVALSGIGELLTQSSPLIVSQLERLTDNPEIVRRLQEMLMSTSGISGWRLATDIPTVGEGLRIVLLLLMAAGMLTLLSGAAALKGFSSARAVGICQAVWNSAAAIALIFSLSRIRALGFDPGLLSGVLSISGLVTGNGVWITLLGLLLGVIGGLLLNTVPSIRSRRRPTSLTKSRARPRRIG